MISFLFCSVIRLRDQNVLFLTFRPFEGTKYYYTARTIPTQTYLHPHTHTHSHTPIQSHTLTAVHISTLFYQQLHFRPSEPQMKIVGAWLATLQPQIENF